VYPRHALEALGEAGLLGLISSPEVGGLGLGFDAAVGMVGGIGAVCASTPPLGGLHFAATAVIEAYGPGHVGKDVAGGRHVTTLAFSERGSRGQFWVPLGTALASGKAVCLDAHKSWVTSAGQADSYVWSSRPVAADGAMTLWLVPSNTPGLTGAAPYQGLGLRGNASSPVGRERVVVADGRPPGDA